MTGNAGLLCGSQRFPRPQINLARSTAGRMWLVNICAFAVVLQSSLTDSFSSLMVAFGAIFGAVLTEFIILHERSSVRLLKDGSAVASALILALLLPNRFSPLCAAAGAAFAMAVVKHSFGGLGSNWLNPAAGGWLFIRLSWPDVFSSALEDSHLSIVKTGAADLFAAATPMDGALRSFLNKTVFSLFGAELPGGYFDLFVSRFSGIIADRGLLALLLGTIVISASGVIRSWIPAVYLAAFGILVRFAGAQWNGDVLFAFFSGGTMTAAFFLTADPATGAKSNGGMLLAAASGGVIAFFFRYLGAEPYAAVYAAVFINALLPLVRIFESRRLYDKRYS